MGVFHFLNVGQGDCSIIQHASGNVTVVDVNHAKPPLSETSSLIMQVLKENYHQKDSPTNPIEYMLDHGIKSVFRFVLSHPDMDHMGGIKAFFEQFSPANFWDTANTCRKDDWSNSPYNREDWDFYCGLRSGANTKTKRLVLHSNDRGKFYNIDGSDNAGGDGLYILSPTPKLVSDANGCEDFNDCSYVILYKSSAGRILLAGDSHDKTWEHVLKYHAADIANVEVLLAPHHGRHSDRDFGFLDVVRPALTLFGNAASTHLAYREWSRRGLPIITNNQAGDVIIDTNGANMQVYVSNSAYAAKINPGGSWDANYRGYWVGEIAAAERVA